MFCILAVQDYTGTDAGTMKQQALADLERLSALVQKLLALPYRKN